MSAPHDKLDQQMQDAFVQQMKVFNGQIRHLLNVHGEAVDVFDVNPQIALAAITELNKRIASMCNPSQS